MIVTIYGTLLVFDLLFTSFAMLTGSQRACAGSIITCLIMLLILIAGGIS